MENEFNHSKNLKIKIGRTMKINEYSKFRDLNYGNDDDNSLRRIIKSLMMSMSVFI